jgi:hypothetical protein
MGRFRQQLTGVNLPIRVVVRHGRRSLLRHLGIDVLVIGQVVVIVQGRIREAFKAQNGLGIDGSRVFRCETRASQQ